MKVSRAASVSLFACLVCHAAAPARLQVALSSTSVKVNANFSGKITLVDAHGGLAPASKECKLAVDVLDTRTQKSIQPQIEPVIAARQSAVEVNLLIRKAGFYGVRASTACLPGIQNGLIYVRVTGGSPAASILRPHLLLVAQTPKGAIDVFYPQDADNLLADGHVAAAIQVFVDPPVEFSLAFDTTATVSPNPLKFAGHIGDGVASLTSTQPGDFTATVSASSIPEGYVVHTHPPSPPMHHFLPDIEFVQVTASSQRGVPLNSAVAVMVQLLDGQKKPVTAASPVAVNLTVNPGSAAFKDNPLTVAAGQSSGNTSFTASASGHYSVDADLGGAKSAGPASINVTAPIGFIAILLGGLAGGCISCLWLKKFEWPRVIYGGLAATGVWLVSGIGVFASISASLVSNSFSAAILGALAGLAGEQVLTLLIKKLFGVEEPPAASPAAPHAAPGS